MLHRTPSCSGLICCVLALGLSLPSAGPAHAQPSNTAVERAEAAYAEGVAAFKAEKFKAAIKLFEEAYLLDPSPILLYNIARAHEELGNAEDAYAWFDRYLARNPSTEDRADVEARMARLSRQRARENPLVLDQPGEQPETDPEPDSVLMPALGWTAVGLGVVALGVGGVSRSQASDTADEAGALEAGERATWARLKDDFDQQNTLAWVGLGAGTLLVAGGITLLLWPEEGPRAEGRAAPVTLRPGFGGFSLSGRF